MDAYTATADKNLRCGIRSPHVIMAVLRLVQHWNGCWDDLTGANAACHNLQIVQVGTPRIRDANIIHFCNMCTSICKGPSLSILWNLVYWRRMRVPKTLHRSFCATVLPFCIRAFVLVFFDIPPYISVSKFERMVRGCELRIKCTKKNKLGR